MLTLIDWILDLFRSEDAARAFVAAPDQAMRDAGLAGVSAAQVSAVAATAVPGLVLGDGDPIVGLQRAVSNQYGFAPAYQPSFAPAYQPTFEPVWAPSPTFAPQTDLASHNDIPLLSPDQDAGANAQQGSFNLGFGDITLGDKSSNSASNGGVVVAGDSGGDIVSGDGAVLGNANDVNNGDVLAGTGSNVAVGHGRIADNGTTATGGSSVIKDNNGPVLHDVDAGGGNGGGAAGGDSLLGIGGGRTSGGDAGGGGITIVSHDTSSPSSASGNQTHVVTDNNGGGEASVVSPASPVGAVVSAHTETESPTFAVTEAAAYEPAHQPLFDAGHDNSLVNGRLDTLLSTGQDTSPASGDHLSGF